MDSATHSFREKKSSSCQIAVFHAYSSSNGNVQAIFHRGMKKFWMMGKYYSTARHPAASRMAEARIFIFETAPAEDSLKATSLNGTAPNVNSSWTSLYTTALSYLLVWSGVVEKRLATARTSRSYRRRVQFAIG